VIPAFKKHITLPNGWEADELSRFLEAAHHNRIASFATKKLAYGKLSSIDSCFLSISNDWLNPASLITPHLFVRAHSSFRAACEHALAGQLAEVFPLTRITLEYAAYALHLYDKPHLEEIWLKRHDSDAALRVVKNEFTIANIRNTITKYNQHGAKVFNNLYQRAIDFGGHPNEGALSTNLRSIESNERREYLQICMHGNGLQMDYGLKTTAQTGVCALETLQDVFKARFELRGIRQKLLELRKGL